MDTELTRTKTLRRRIVRCFVAIALLSIAIDTAPRWPFTAPLQDLIRPVLNVTGLWQGDWPLFAPNPVINNGWISAEFYKEGDRSPILTPEDKPLSWNSPIWSEYSAWNKFYRFRHMNYFNRATNRGKDVLDDLADYIAHEKLGPEFHYVDMQTNKRIDKRPKDESDGPIELRLSKNGLKIVLPEDGSFPSRDETTWVYVGSGLGMRKYTR